MNGRRFFGMAGAQREKLSKWRDEAKITIEKRWRQWIGVFCRGLFNVFRENKWRKRIK
jgi:hypothetical protein